VGRKAISFCCSVKEILEQQLINYISEVGLLEPFSAIAKALAGRMLCRPALKHAARWCLTSVEKEKKTTDTYSRPG